MTDAQAKQPWPPLQSPLGPPIVAVLWDELAELQKLYMACKKYEALASYALKTRGSEDFLNALAACRAREKAHDDA